MDWEESQRLYRGRYQLIAGNEKDELQKIDLSFTMEKIKSFWRFTEVKIECFRPVGSDDPLNPLNYKVYASVYKVNNYSLLKNILDNWDQVHLTGEFEEGNCYKWFKTVNILDTGINVSRDIYGEFILTNEELIIFSDHLQNLTEVSHHCQDMVFNNKGIEMQLLAKGISRVRNVYRVITERGFSLGTYLANKNKIYYLDLANNDEYWYALLSKKAEKRYLVDGRIEVCELAEGTMEVINYDGHCFIFTYGASPNFIELEWPDLWKNVREITYGREFNDEKEIWQYYKLISNLKKIPTPKF